MIKINYIKITNFVSGHFRNAINNEESSLYEGALNPNVKLKN